MWFKCIILFLSISLYAVSPEIAIRDLLCVERNRRAEFASSIACEEILKKLVNNFVDATNTVVTIQADLQVASTADKPGLLMDLSAAQQAEAGAAWAIQEYLTRQGTGK